MSQQRVHFHSKTNSKCYFSSRHEIIPVYYTLAFIRWHTWVLVVHELSYAWHFFFICTSSNIILQHLCTYTTIRVLYLRYDHHDVYKSQPANFIKIKNKQEHELLNHLGGHRTQCISNTKAALLKFLKRYKAIESP